MPRVYIARHGETTWNAIGRYQGRQESQLSELGVRQAAALGVAMSTLEIGRIISSPLMRCVATAAPAAALAHCDIALDERLVEIAHGQWEGRLRDELAQHDPQRYGAWRNDPANVAFPDGESMTEVLARWRSFCSWFRPQEPTLLLTHDVIARLALIEGNQASFNAFWSVPVANGAFSVFEVDGPQWRLVEACVSDHLGPLVADQSRQAL